ncbi:UNVERIFIED_ORG: hypothetical protein ABIC54_004243 [Burkholderia sp. 1263]
MGRGYRGVRWAHDRSGKVCTIPEVSLFPDGAHPSAQTKYAMQYGTLGVTWAPFNIPYVDVGKRSVTLRVVIRFGREVVFVR